MTDIKRPAVAETFAIEFKSGPSVDGSSYAFTHRYVRSFSNMTLSVDGSDETFTALPVLDFSMDEGFVGTIVDETFVITIDSAQLPVAYRINGQFPEIECFVYQVDQDIEGGGASPTATLFQRGFLRQMTVRAKGDPNLTELKFSSVKGFLSEYPVGVTASNLCGWRFGDNSCQAEVRTFSATITSISNTLVTCEVAGAPLAIPELFNNGFMKIDNLALTIRDYGTVEDGAYTPYVDGNIPPAADDVTFNLYKQPPTDSTYTWLDRTASVVEGCNKLYDTCALKIDSTDGVENNHRHFGGFGIRMPAFNPQTEEPQSSNMAQFNAANARIGLLATPSPRVNVGLQSVWEPTAVSPAAWYQASSISGSDGDSVGSWSDSSGNGNTAAQVVSARQPTLQTEELGGKSVVRFDGTNDILSDSDIAALDVGTGDIFMAAVFKSTDDSAAQFFFEKGTTQFGLMTTASGVLQARMGGTTNIPQQSAGNWSRTDYVIVTASRVSSSCTGFVNGTAMTTTGTTNTGSISNSSVLDLGAAAVGGQAMTGDLAEVIVGGGTLADADRLRLEGYLAHKYGLHPNLPSNHTYRFVAP